MAFDDEDMPDDEYDTEETGSPLSVLANSNATTPEARALAAGVFGQLYRQRGQYDADEQKAFDEYETRAREARARLQEARDKLLAKKRSKQEMFLAAAAGFGAPTRSGSFAESLGNAAGQMLPVAKDNREWEDARDKQVLEYDTGLSALDQQLALNRLKLQQARRTADTRLMDSALRIMARPDAQSRWKPLGPQSKYAKMAFDEGLQPGTPQYAARINQLYQEDQALQREKSGTDVDEALTPDERDALSQRFGAPVMPTDPYAGLSTKARQAARMRAAQEAQKLLSGMSEESGQFLSANDMLDRFMYLNKQQPSGRVSGWNPLPSAAGQEMDSITAKLSRQERQPGEGQISNFDASQFIKATLSRKNKYEVNLNLSKAIKARNKLILDRVKFFGDYAAVNDNNLQGAQQAWNQYLEANPIFDPTKPGEYALNPKHMEYRQWFNERSKQKGFAEGGEVTDEEPDYEHIPRRKGAVHASLQGVTLGLSDELADLLGEGGTEDERALLEQFSNESPVSSFGAEFAGSLIPAGATMAALSRIRSRAKAKGKTGKVASTALRLVPKSKLGKAIGAGAGAGAVTGFNSEGDFDQRLDRALEGAEMGAVLGPVTAYAGEGALKLGRKAWDKVANSKYNTGVVKYLEALKRDALTPKDVAQQVVEDAHLGVPSTVGDVGGHEVQALSQHVMSKDAPGARALVQKTEGLQRGARDRVEDQINRALKPDPYFAQEQKLVAEMRANADPLYQAAYAQPPIPLANTRIYEILSTPPGQRAMRQAIKTLQSQVPAKGLGKADATGMMTHISTEALNEIKIRLGVMERQAKLKQDNHTASLIGDLRRELVAEADKVNPLYAKARAQFGDDVEVVDALHFGRDEALNLEPEQIAAQVQNMSFSARDAMRTGLARNLMEQVREPARAKNFAEFINSPAMQERITAAFDRPQDARIFIAALSREAQLSGTRGAALRGAQQRAQTRAHAALEGTTPGQAAGAAGEAAGIGNAMMGELAPLGIVARVLGFLRSRMPMTQGTADQIARVLSTGGPREVTALMKQLDEHAQLMERRAAAGEDLNTLLSTGEGLTFGSPDLQGYRDEEAR